MPKVKTTDRLKQHRYQPTKVSLSVDSLKATEETSDFQLAKSSTPNSIFEALQNEDSNQKLNALVALNQSMNSQEEAMPFIKKNLTGQLLKFLEPTVAIDLVLEATGVLRNLAFVAPEDTLNEWIQLKLITKLQTNILPVISNLIAESKDDSKKTAKTYDFIENVFAIILILGDFSEKAVSQLTVESVDFATNVLLRLKSPENVIPYSLAVLMIEFLFLVTSDTQHLNQHLESGDIGSILSDLVSDQQAFQKLSWSDCRYVDQQWVRIIAAGCLINSDLYLSESSVTLNTLLGSFYPSLQYSFTESLVGIINKITAGENSNESELADATKDICGMMKNAQTSLEILSNLLADEELDDIMEEDEEQDNEVADENEEVPMEEEKEEVQEEQLEVSEKTSTSKLRIIQDAFVNQGFSSSMTILELYSKFLGALGIHMCEPLPMPQSHTHGALLVPLSESLFQLQVSASGCLNNFFGSLSTETLSLLEGESSVDAIFNKLALLTLDMNHFYVSRLPDNWPAEEVDSTRIKLFQRNCDLVDKLLTALWSLGRSLIDSCQRSPNPSEALAILDRLVHLYNSLAHDAQTSLVRMKIISVIGVLVCHPQLPSDVAIAVGDFMVTRLEGKPTPNETAPIVQAEIMNALMDMFGPDTHNVVFSKSNWLPRLKACMPILKAQMKQIDPRVRSLKQLQKQQDQNIDNRAIKERMREMIFNMNRFIQYKEQMDKVGR